MSEMRVAMDVHEIAKMISGAPFPSIKSLRKAREIVERFESRRAPQWQPISSAPKDGRWIMIGKPGHDEVLLAYWDRLRGAWWGQGGGDGQWKKWQDATSWQPLPAPPEVEG